MIFDNVSFDAKKYKGAVAEGKTLYIYTTDKNYDIDYTSNKEAVAALVRIDLLCSGNQSDEAGSVLDSVQSIFGSVLKKAKDKGAEVISGYDVHSLMFQMAKDIALNTAKEKATEIINTIDDALSKVLNKEEESPPVAKPEATQNKRFTFSEDAFNGEKEEELTEPTVGEMSPADLEKAIDSFIKQAMNNPSTKQTLEQLMSMFSLSSGDIDKVQDAMKEVILEMAQMYPNAKLSEIIKRLM